MYKRESLNTVSRNVNWYSHYENSMEVPQKLKTELPYGLEIPLLDIHLKEMKSPKDTYTPIFTEALFLIAKTQKQPQCPSIDKQIKKMSHTHTYPHALLFSHDEEGSPAIYNSMAQYREHYAKRNKSKTDTI